MAPGIDTLGPMGTIKRLCKRYSVQDYYWADSEPKTIHCLYNQDPCGPSRRSYMARKKMSIQEQKDHSPSDMPASAAEDSVEAKPDIVADPGVGPDARPKTGFPIVGIGASAGGLAAFEAFFSAMPADTDSGIAFVLVQHLSPDHKSILADLVKRYTHMQVYEVEDGMEVKPNCAYIIPPNRDMAFRMARCSCWSRLRRTACACPSTISSDP